MRRPLKPFVTEYKATNRRPKDGAGVFGSEPPEIAEAPARKGPKGVEAKAALQKAPFKSESSKPSQQTRRGEAPRSGEPRYSGAPSEDNGYEAAMRAADALFSGAPGRETSPARETMPPHDEFARPDGASQSDVDMAPPSTPGSTGRILRVLDEEPNPALLALEAERAPKRRGRKPGSKNKPKVPAMPSLDTVPEPIYAFESRHDHDVPPVARPVAASIIYFPQPASRGGERFAWVRTRLRPGESWKRRLPKVIW